MKKRGKGGAIKRIIFQSSQKRRSRISSCALYSHPFICVAFPGGAIFLPNKTSSSAALNHENGFIASLVVLQLLQAFVCICIFSRERLAPNLFVHFSLGQRVIYQSAE
jgi:hypothetical protein